MLAASQIANASILTFDITNPNNPLYSGTEAYPEGYPINPNYGDRVTAITATDGIDTFAYGVGAEGFTPNVTAEYGPFTVTPGPGFPELWRYDYGDLDHILYQGSRGANGATDYNVLTIELIADPGYEVQLYGFDLGGWNQTDYEINGVAVFDGIPFPFITPTNQIFQQYPADVLGAGPTHTTFSFGTPLQSDHIYILIDANNLGSDSELIGIDNIRFGQVEAVAAVPEPTTLAIWGIGALGCAVSAYRRRKQA